jgi:uncharacterized protein
MTKELIEYLAKKVVDNADAVSVEETPEMYVIRVGDGEEGRVIGRQGRVIQAIRTIARAAAGPRERVQVDVFGASSRSADGTDSRSADGTDSRSTEKTDSSSETES